MDFQGHEVGLGAWVGDWTGDGIRHPKLPPAS